MVKPAPNHGSRILWRGRAFDRQLIMKIYSPPIASVLFVLALALHSGQVRGQVQDSLKGLPLINLTIPEVRFDKTPLAQVARELEDAANKAKKGGRPVEIEFRSHTQRTNPLVTAHIIGQNLDTILRFVTEQAGYGWTIQEGKIVLFTNPELLERDRLVRALPGRLKMKSVRIPSLTFDQTPLSEALRELQAEAVRNGLRNLETGRGPWEIEQRARFAGSEPLISGKFINSDVDTILEILTKQTRAIDWSTENGKVIIVQLGQEPSGGGGGGAVDPFSAPAGPVDPFAAPASSRGTAAYRQTTIGGRVAVPSQPGADGQFNTESYQDLRDNPFLSPRNEPLSTFSIDVDTASYANVRRFIMQMGQAPPVDSVRIEEMINYFDYGYAPPLKVENPERPDLPVDHPFATHVEVAAAPWKKEHRLVKIGLKGYEVPLDNRPASNLVFLLDVSGSMSSPNKLPLVQSSLNLLLKGLTEKDRVAIVVYAGSSGLVLESTPGSNKNKIRRAINRLKSGGSTNAGEGIELAYRIAEENLIKKGNNRVILCTDGDFNVGTTDKGSLRRIIEEKSEKGVQLTVLGFGMGNYKDDMLETLSNYGDGNYGYIDGIREARKLFAQRLLGTLIMIAKDVKIQVEFNPLQVAAYRLIGYENRLLKNEEFEDDEIDAGDIGSGHTVTALYEIVPPGVELPRQPGKIELRYQKNDVVEPKKAVAGELLNLKLRYKWPRTDDSRLIETPVIDGGAKFEDASPDMKFAASVAGFGMLLRKSPHSGDFSHDEAHAIAKENLGKDPHGDRKEFLEILKQFVW